MCVYQHFIQIPSGTGGLYGRLCRIRVLMVPGAALPPPFFCLLSCVRTAVPFAFILKNEGVRGN